MFLHHGLRTAAAAASATPATPSYTFAHNSSTSIQGTFGGYSRTATYYSPPTNLGSNITYGSQNSTPFNTSTDWNNDIVRAYSYGYYKNSYGRIHAPVIPVLMERPPQGNGSYPSAYLNDWESAWWHNHVGYHQSDILIVVFDAVKTISAIEFSQTTSFYNPGTRAGDWYAAALTGSASSFTQTALGSVNYASLTSGVPRTISFSPSIQAQAIAIWHAGSSGWLRVGAIRFLK